MVRNSDGPQIYFLPGKVEGIPVQFIIDTGSTTNLIFKQVFDRLPLRVQECLLNSNSYKGMAVDFRLAFYNLAWLS